MTRHRIAQIGENRNPKSPENRPQTRRFLQIRLLQLRRSATPFNGLAVLHGRLLDLAEFGRRFRGAAVASSVVRAQTVYWAGRATFMFGAVIFLTLIASALAAIVPGASRAVVAGLGAVLAFAGALYAVVRRTES